MNDVANHPKVGTARGCISRNSGIPKEIMDALQGHGEEGMSRRYGKGYVLRKLAEAMGQLRYDDLDLGHLKRMWHHG
jgi:hypothetical protein